MFVVEKKREKKGEIKSKRKKKEKKSPTASGSSLEPMVFIDND